MNLLRQRRSRPRCSTAAQMPAIQIPEGIRPGTRAKKPSSASYSHLKRLVGAPKSLLELERKLIGRSTIHLDFCWMLHRGTFQTRTRTRDHQTILRRVKDIPRTLPEKQARMCDVLGLDIDARSRSRSPHLLHSRVSLLDCPGRSEFALLQLTQCSERLCSAA